METFSALLAICAGKSPAPGELPTQRPVTQSFDVFFDLRLNKRLSKQSWGWWFETLSCPLWRHCNDTGTKWIQLYPMRTMNEFWHIFNRDYVCSFAENLMANISNITKLSRFFWVPAWNQLIEIFAVQLLYDHCKTIQVKLWVLIHNSPAEKPLGFSCRQGFWPCWKRSFKLSEVNLSGDAILIMIKACNRGVAILIC